MIFNRAWQERERASTIPAPGSARAISAGCECPVTLNNKGAVPPEEGWWYAPNCPVHPR